METSDPLQVNRVWYAVFFTFTTPLTLQGMGAFCKLTKPQLSHVQNGLITKGIVWAKVSF